MLRPMLRSTLILGCLLLSATVAGLLGFRQRIHEIPYEEMDKVFAIMKTRAPVNTMVAPGQKTAKTVIPRNNMDAESTYCVVNLKRGPVRLSGPLPESYWSLSIYTPDSLNPYVVSDRDLDPDSNYDIIVATGSQAASLDGSVSRLLPVEAEEVIALMRWYVPTESERANIDELRRAAICEPLGGR